VFATPDLTATSAWFADRTGVTPTAGGQHIGLGTRNMLVALSDSTYLEIVGPDPDQADPVGPRPFGIDDLDDQTLVTFAVKATDLPGHVERCAEAGLDIGGALDMSRAKPDGSLLEWSLTIARWVEPVRPLPFLIDWRGTPSPALDSAPGIELADLQAQHPEPDILADELAVLGYEIPIRAGATVALQATLATPNGTVELR